MSSKGFTIFKNELKFAHLTFAYKISLLRHYNAVDTLASNGMIFWDYGNAFLLEVSRALGDAANTMRDPNSNNKFKYPSYMQDVLGDIFSLGFGPFR